MNMPIPAPVQEIDLVAQFQFDPVSMRELVTKVSHGLHPHWAPADLVGKVLKAQKLRLQAALNERNEHSESVDREQRHLQILSILAEYVDILTHPPRPELELVQEELELRVEGAPRVFLTGLRYETLGAACDLLKEMCPHDRNSFGFGSSPSGLEIGDLFHRYFHISREFPMLFAFDEDGKARGLGALFRDAQFPSIGNLASGVTPSFDDSGLREGILNILIQMALGQFHTVQAYVSGAHLPAIQAYQNMGFDNLEIPNELSDGMGGYSSRFLFLRKLVTDEEYTSAAD